ncbi:mersacidin/lichenicidin family type 2 lantibiotic [Dactylosporangium sp. CA-233914]|uniref:mersacidin/lichenicidin family type 2 lantibiotic n=1 Tax=Dactylosporangium sp. CA-233914 TaxID=3239934 RepID=UPI003D8F859A
MNDNIRAWKDPAYRATLGAAERAAMLDNPVGAVADPEPDLAPIFGGGDRPFTFRTCFTCDWACGPNTRNIACTTWPFC